MKLLCIDTSSTLCSVAILEDTTLLKKIELEKGLTHSEILMPTIDEILTSCKLTLKDIDLLVCDVGPGSFTGIRIGVATVKAFADSLCIPCVGISSLEVLARFIQKDGIICSSIDCKNDNCYFAIYELKSGVYHVIEEPKAATLEEVQSLLKTKYTSSPISFVGDGILKDCSNVLDVYQLGIAGYTAYTSSNYQKQEVLPLYLKKPLAQRQLEEKLAKLNKT